MPNYVLTGAPGAGKTALLRAAELAGVPVVEEAATDVIALDMARGVRHPRPDAASFVRDVLALQRLRADRSSAAHAKTPVLFDRSEICTLALARYVGIAPPPALLERIAWLAAERHYEPEVLFVRTFGSTTRTAARLISHEDALRFERIHQRTYRELGFRLVEIRPGPLDQRAATVLSVLRGRRGAPRG